MAWHIPESPAQNNPAGPDGMDGSTLEKPTRTGAMARDPAPTASVMWQFTRSVAHRARTSTAATWNSRSSSRAGAEDRDGLRYPRELRKMRTNTRRQVSMRRCGTGAGAATSPIAGAVRAGTARKSSTGTIGQRGGMTHGAVWVSPSRVAGAGMGGDITAHIGARGRARFQRYLWWPPSGARPSRRATPW